VNAPLPPEVVEVKRRLNGDEVRFVCRPLALVPGRRAVLAFRMSRTYRPPIPGAPVVPEGTWTLAHYWRDRPYNLYHWVDVAGREFGAYFNLCRPPTRIGRRGVIYQDLALDLWAGTGGPHLLDREEIGRDSPASLRREVAQALCALRREWRRRLVQARRQVPALLSRLAVPHG